MADLYAIPAATDVTLLCTNLRDKNGKRPIFADDSSSVFVFPMIHMRFIEVPPGTVEETDDGVPRLGAGVAIPARGSRARGGARDRRGLPASGA